MKSKKRTCRIVVLPNYVAEEREGRPHVNRWHPSRKRLLAAGRQVGRKSRRALPLALAA